MKPSIQAFEAYEMSADDAQNARGGLSFAVLANAPDGTTNSIATRINAVADRYNNLTSTLAGLYQEKEVTLTQGGQTVSTLTYEISDPALAARLSNRMKVLLNRYVQLAGMI
jgi:hypothetical protein